MGRYVASALLALLTALAAALWLLGLAQDIDPRWLDNGVCSGNALSLSRLGLGLLVAPTLLLALFPSGRIRGGAALLLLALFAGLWRGAALDADRAAACGPEWPGA